MILLLLIATVLAAGIFDGVPAQCRSLEINCGEHTVTQNESAPIPPIEEDDNGICHIQCLGDITLPIAKLSERVGSMTITGDVHIGRNHGLYTSIYADLTITGHATIQRATSIGTLTVDGATALFEDVHMNRFHAIRSTVSGHYTAEVVRLSEMTLAPGSVSTVDTILEFDLVSAEGAEIHALHDHVNLLAPQFGADTTRIETLGDVSFNGPEAQIVDAGAILGKTSRRVGSYLTVSRYLGAPEEGAAEAAAEMSISARSDLAETEASALLYIPVVGLLNVDASEQKYFVYEINPLKMQISLENFADVELRTFTMIDDDMDSGSLPNAPNVWVYSRNRVYVVVERRLEIEAVECDGVIRWDAESQANSKAFVYIADYVPTRQRQWGDAIINVTASRFVVRGGFVFLNELHVKAATIELTMYRAIDPYFFGRSFTFEDFVGWSLTWTGNWRDTLRIRSRDKNTQVSVFRLNMWDKGQARVRIDPVNSITGYVAHVLDANDCIGFYYETGYMCQSQTSALLEIGDETARAQLVVEMAGSVQYFLQPFRIVKFEFQSGSRAVLTGEQYILVYDPTVTESFIMSPSANQANLLVTEGSKYTFYAQSSAIIVTNRLSDVAFTLSDTTVRMDVPDVSLSTISGATSKLYARTLKAESLTIGLARIQFANVKRLIIYDAQSYIGVDGASWSGTVIFNNGVKFIPTEGASLAEIGMDYQILARPAPDLACYEDCTGTAEETADCVMKPLSDMCEGTITITIDGECSSNVIVAAISNFTFSVIYNPVPYDDDWTRRCPPEEDLECVVFGEDVEVQLLGFSKVVVHTYSSTAHTRPTDQDFYNSAQWSEHMSAIILRSSHMSLTREEGVSYIRPTSQYDGVETLDFYIPDRFPYETGSTVPLPIVHIEAGVVEMTTGVFSMDQFSVKAQYMIWPTEPADPDTPTGLGSKVPIVFARMVKLHLTGTDKTTFRGSWSGSFQLIAPSSVPPVNIEYVDVYERLMVGGGESSADWDPTAGTIDLSVVRAEGDQFQGASMAVSTLGGVEFNVVDFHVDTFTLVSGFRLILENAGFLVVMDTSLPYSYVYTFGDDAMAMYKKSGSTARITGNYVADAVVYLNRDDPQQVQAKMSVISWEYPGLVPQFTGQTSTLYARYMNGYTVYLGPTILLSYDIRYLSLSGEAYLAVDHETWYSRVVFFEKVTFIPANGDSLADYGLDQQVLGRYYEGESCAYPCTEVNEQCVAVPIVELCNGQVDISPDDLCPADYILVNGEDVVIKFIDPEDDECVDPPPPFEEEEEEEEEEITPPPPDEEEEEQEPEEEEDDDFDPCDPPGPPEEEVHPDCENEWCPKYECEASYERNNGACKTFMFQIPCDYEGVRTDMDKLVFEPYTRYLVTKTSNIVVNAMSFYKTTAPDASNEYKSNVDSLYVRGKVLFMDAEITRPLRIYVMEGGVVTFKQFSAYNFPEIYIHPKGRVDFGVLNLNLGSVKIKNWGKLFMHGNVTYPPVSLPAGSSILRPTIQNCGYFYVQGHMELGEGIVNNGYMNVRGYIPGDEPSDPMAYFDPVYSLQIMYGTGSVVNTGEVVANGTRVMEGATLENHGLFSVSGNFRVDATGSTLTNNCTMSVTGECIIASDTTVMTLNEGSGLTCGVLRYDENVTIVMESNALLHAKEAVFSHGYYISSAAEGRALVIVETATTMSTPRIVGAIDTHTPKLLANWHPVYVNGARFIEGCMADTKLMFDGVGCGCFVAPELAIADQCTAGVDCALTPDECVLVYEDGYTPEEEEDTTGGDSKSVKTNSSWQVPVFLGVGVLGAAGLGVLLVHLVAPGAISKVMGRSGGADDEDSDSDSSEDSGEIESRQDATEISDPSDISELESED